jgi:hypothetical protein
MILDKIKKIFKKKPKEVKQEIRVEEPLVVKKKPLKKETRETKSSLTFGV